MHTDSPSDVARFISDYDFIAGKFAERGVYFPNLLRPKTFTEKMNRFKISDGCESYSQYLDKYESREIARSRIGEEYLIPLIARYQSIDALEADFDNLPDQFVMKANHGSGMNIVCRNKKKLNKRALLDQAAAWLKTNYYDIHREREYRTITPCILVEQYLEDTQGKADDFKFECFNGEPLYVQVFTDRGSAIKSTVFDMDWRPAPFALGHEPIPYHVFRPRNFDRMIRIARALAEGFSYARIDLYNIDGEIYFGEYTLTPSAGFRNFVPKLFDRIFGDMLPEVGPPNIPKKGIVYTCITDNYDSLSNHGYMSPEWDYVCFSDKPIQRTDRNDNWIVRPLEFTASDRIRNQRWHKTHPHILFPEYERSIWIDGNNDIRSPSIFHDIANSIENNKAIAIPPHAERNCIYEELDACIALDKDNPQIMREEIEYIRSRGFPPDQGLFETHIMFRMHHDPANIKLMNGWWSMIEKFSYRDQLSLTFVAWTQNITINLLGSSSFRNDKNSFYFLPHQNETHTYIYWKERHIQELDRQLAEIRSSKYYQAWQRYLNMKKFIFLLFTGGLFKLALGILSNQISAFVIQVKSSANYTPVPPRILRTAIIS